MLLAVFTIGTLSTFIICKATVTTESSTMKEKEADDKYFTGAEVLSLTYTQIILRPQPVFHSSLYQSVYIEITPPPPNRC